MTVSNKLRIKDKSGQFYKNKEDFFVRQFGISSIKVIKFLLAVLAIVTAVPFVFYKLYDTNDDVVELLYCYNGTGHAWIMVASLTAVLTGVVLLVSGRQVKFNKDALDATEFLNALFASALGQGYDFCLIVTQADLRVFYLNRNFQTIFPEAVTLEECSLDLLLNMYGVAKSDQTFVLDAVKRDTSSQVKLKMKAGSEKTLGMVALSIEPVLRPSGYCLIRGRKES